MIRNIAEFLIEVATGKDLVERGRDIPCKRCRHHRYIDEKYKNKEIITDKELTKLKYQDKQARSEPWFHTRDENGWDWTSTIWARTKDGGERIAGSPDDEDRKEDFEEMEGTIATESIASQDSWWDVYNDYDFIVFSRNLMPRIIKTIDTLKTKLGELESGKD